MSQAAESNKVVTWEGVIAEAMPKFQRIARNTNLVRWEEESQFASQALRKNELLAKCTVDSVQNAIINVAAVGLTLNPADQYAYLVPEYNKQIKANECQLRISFKGLIKVANDSGAIKWVQAEVVKESDGFAYKGPCTLPGHSMNPFGDRGETVGVYCIAKTNEGDILVDIMSKQEIDKIASCAKTASVWAKWPDEMAKKAIIKRAAKQWPKTAGASTLNHAIQVINDHEGGFDPMARLEEIANEIIDLLEKDDLLEAGRIWSECDDEEKSQLWVAKTKGGFFTQDEKVLIRKAIQMHHESNVIEGEKE